MKWIPALLLICLSSFSVKPGDDDVFKKMHKKYAGQWYNTFSFKQTTETFRNDSLIRTATWSEWIVFPDKFRISFGEPKEGNAAIFTPDSVYSFRKSKLVRTTPNNDDLTFILGGMYFYSYDEAKARLKKQGYDPDKSFETTFNGEPVYVIGAKAENDKSDQLWIDKKKLVPVRFIKYDGEHSEEGLFSNHKQYGKAWSETYCEFYRDGKLIQKETYFDCKAGEEIDLKLFDPHAFIVPD